jgi:hypothetical protein
MRMTLVPLTLPFVGSRWKSTPLIAGMAGLLILAGCGKAPEPAAPPTTEATPEPTGTPASGKPSLVIQPPAASQPESTPAAKVVYVIEGFEAVSTDGTHEIPTGAAVTVLAEEEDEYLISYENLSVRTPKAYFSETRIEEAARTEPEASQPAASESADTMPSATPDAITLNEEPPAPAETATLTEETVITTAPEPAATPDPALAETEAKTRELMEQIRSINDEIRAATDKMEGAPSAEKAKEAAKIKRLKKRRNALSEDLTKVAKP